MNTTAIQPTAWQARRLLLVLCIAAATSQGARAQSAAQSPVFPAVPAAIASNDKPDLFIYRHYGTPE